MINQNSYVGRTLNLMKKISDYRSRYQPLELQLQKNGGLLKQIYEKDEKKIIRPRLEEIGIKGIAQLKRDVGQSTKKIDNKSLSQVTQIDHDGLISEIIYIQNSQRRKKEISELSANTVNDIEEFCRLFSIKVMICITMYSEPLQELQKSLQGIQDSLDEFYENDILPNQILVVVIYDGIENIRNQGDENGNNQEGDIIPYFCQYLDKQNNIEEEKTLDSQYKMYKYKKDIIQKYSLEQRKLFQQKTDSSKEQYIKNDRILRKKIKQKLGNEYNFEDVVNTMEFEYQQAKKYIELRQNNAFVYQSTQTVKLPDQEDSQLPIFHVFKFANGTKLSSHLWFFKGFCHEFKPDYCVLMDCGARPQKGSIHSLIKELINNDQVGGVCGTMTIELSKTDDQKGEHMDTVSKLLNVDIFNIERCQKCEYDIGNLLDKQFESALNFIQVLPGAYSAYRYKAFSTKYQPNTQVVAGENDAQINVNNQSQKNEDILDYYLKSKLDPNYEHGTLEEANMFLAEDRVLCLYLFCNGYYLKYVRNALVEVDPPQNIIQLLLQRRRWINGSYFALNYVIRKFGEQLPNSGHSFIDKCLFIVCLVFAKISQMMQYYVISLQIIWLYMIIKTLTDNIDPIVNAAIKQIIIGGYVFLVFMLIYLSLNYNSMSTCQAKNKKKIRKEVKSINTSILNFMGYLLFQDQSVLQMLDIHFIYQQLNCYSYQEFDHQIHCIIIMISSIFFYIYIHKQKTKNNHLLSVINRSPFNFINVPQDLPSYIYLIVLISFILTVLPFILQLCIDRKLVQLIFIYIIKRQFLIVFQIAINSIHYIYYMPTYTHLFITYSFCRIDDLTWGTKGLTSELENKEQSNKESDKKYQKFKFVAEWILWNVLLTLFFYFLFYLEIQNIIVIIIQQANILAFGVVLSILQLAKFIGFFKYWVQFIFSQKSPTRVHNTNIFVRSNKRERSKKYKEKTKLLYQLNPQDEGQSINQINQ